MDVIAIAVLVASVSATRAAPNLRHVEAFLVRSASSPRRSLRPSYHVAPETGWLTTPAAFLHYAGKYHLFYQYHPYDGAWGPPQWGHVASADLARWTHYPPALLPEQPHERFGCLAGSALEHDSHLVLFYTGVTVAGNATELTQSIAVSSDAVIFHEYAYNPVIRNVPADAAEVREPKVWRHRAHWLMLAGAQFANRGALLRYVSDDLHSWRSDGVAARSSGDTGDAWEGSDLFELDGFCVLLLSARGLRRDGDRYHDARRTGYALRRLDAECLSAQIDDFEVSTATFEELDYGHDAYAARTTVAADGRRLLVVGLAGAGREARQGWAGTLSLVRELRVGRRGLVATPARELVRLRGELLERASYSPGESFEAGARAFELLANASSAAEDAELSLEWSDGRFAVQYQAERGRVSVSRWQSGEADERGADWAPRGDLRWRLFVDRSSVEVFCGAGEVVFSSRVYPSGALWVRVAARAELHVTQYRMKRSIGYDRKLNKYIRDKVLAKTVKQVSEFN